MVRKDRGLRWARMTFTALRQADDKLHAMVGMFEDITERKEADEALRASHQRFDAVFDVSALAIALMDNKGSLTKCNAALSKLSGYSQEELKCKNFADLSHPEDREKYESALAECRGGKQDRFDIDIRLVRKNGGRVWAKLSVSKLAGVDGSPPRMVCVAQDVTSSKENEEAFSGSESRFRGLFDDAVVGAALVDEKGSVIESNAALEDLLGYSKEELKAKAFGELIHSEDTAVYSHPFTECVEGKRDRFQVENRLLNKKGGVVWARTKGTAFRKDGAFQSMALMLEDLTALRETENTLKVTEEKLCETDEKLQASDVDRLAEVACFEALYKGAGMAVAVMDDQGQLIETNAALQRMLGCSESELESKSLKDITHPDDDHEDDPLQAECIAGKTHHYEVEKRLKGKGGDPIWVRMTAAVLSDAEGSLECTFLTFEDITARKQLEQNLKSTEKQLRLEEFDHRDSETRFEEFFENAGIGIALLDDDGRFTQSNPAFQDMLGYSADQLKNKTFKDLGHPDDPVEDVSFHRECVEGRRDHYQVEKRYVRADRSAFWGRFTVTGVRDDEGAYKFAIGILEDVQDYKQVANKPRMETVSLRLRSPEEGFISTDTKNHIVLMNHAAERMLGWKQSDAFAKPLKDVFQVFEESDRHRLESAGEGASEGSAVLKEIKLRLRDDRDRTVLQISRPLIDMEGNSMGTMMVFRDLAEIIKMEKELVDAGKVESGGIMDSQIANEFDNILTNLNILAVPLLGELHDDMAGANSAKKAAKVMKDLSRNLATLTGMSQRSLA